MILIPVAMERAILWNLICSKCLDYAGWEAPEKVFYCVTHALEAKE